MPGGAIFLDEKPRWLRYSTQVEICRIFVKAGVVGLERWSARNFSIRSTFLAGK
jgi:hypothetical protein